MYEEGHKNGIEVNTSVVFHMVPRANSEKSEFQSALEKMF